MKKIFAFLSALLVTYASFAISPIGGTFGVCTGSSTTLTDATGGGYWTSSNYSVASVGTSSGSVYGISPGTATISYFVGVSYVTVTFQVSPTPSPITGGYSYFCVGTTHPFTDTVPGGVWSSAETSIATVGSTGQVYGVSPGVAVIYYTMGVGCDAFSEAYVEGAVVLPILGATSMCTGSTLYLADSAGGGFWSSSNPAVASMGSTWGSVIGNSAGTATITYEVTSTCDTAYAYSVITVTGTGSAGTISGASTVATGTTITLTDGVSGGTWSSSNTSVATINATSGVVTGISSGVATMTYTVSGCSGPVYTTYSVTDSDIAGISGYVVFPGGYSGNVKVWLITFNTSTLDLEAVDSTLLTCAGDSVFYQFTGEPTDSYRIKAAVTTYDSVGFIPTYRFNSLYWNTANVLYYFSGTSDNFQDILMNYGTVPTGAGFISGNVSTGANRGTSGSAGAPGILMIAETSTGSIIEQTYTDASGNYIFHNLPTGSYKVHPEAINYISYDYTSVSLTTSTPSLNNIDFIQHTISHTITPGSTGVATVQSASTSVIAYPNPTSGKLNIQWMEAGNENGTVTISDITGREVFKTGIKMTEGLGSSQVDLSALTSGLYIINVTSGSVNYTSKVQVQH